MPPKKVRKRIRTEPVRPKEPKGRPKCPQHKTPMEFDRDRMVWHCTLLNCTMIAHPAHDMGGSKPAVFSGPFELLNMFDPDEGVWRWIIKCDKVYFDVTDILNCTPDLIGSGKMVIDLEFDTFHKLDGEGNLIE